MHIRFSGVEYVAKVMEKEAAEREFGRAKEQASQLNDSLMSPVLKISSQQGLGAGYAHLVPEDNLVSVSVVLQSHTFVKFSLKYEELLERKLGRYKHTVYPTPPFGTERIK